MNLTGCEDVWIKVSTTPKTNIIVSCIPQNDLSKFQRTFFSKLEILKSNDCVLLGDLNKDYGQYGQSTKVKEYSDSVTSLGYRQIINLPRRISSSQQSIIDHIYINETNLNKLNIAAVVQTDI